MAQIAGRRIKLETTGAIVTVHADVTLDRIVEACERRASSLEDPGFCIDCGQEARQVEPDAREYKCESCGMYCVFGAEELLLMLA